MSAVEELRPCDVVRLVRLLPREVIAQLATGPAEDEAQCGVCRALRGIVTAPIVRTPANRLQEWHEQLVLHDPGRGHRQDPVRCGVIYGAAAALSAPGEAPSEGRGG